ncbi:MAG TPA: hypothetical protein VGG33_25520 [Polyangia bacterium]
MTTRQPPIAIVNPPVSVPQVPSPARGRNALTIYVGRIREFSRTDWIVYLAWVGMMAGLAIVSAGFLIVGRNAGAVFPTEAYLLPVGATIFTFAIGVDTIGHRTIYREVLKGGEALVHHVTIATGIGACVFLIAAYPQRTGLAIIAAVLTALSFLYSLIDEAMHWRRYLSRNSDVVEMWSHVFILIGHGTLMAGWWRWYLLDYAGVAPTLRALGLAS